MIVTQTGRSLTPNYPVVLIRWDTIRGRRSVVRALLQEQFQLCTAGTANISRKTASELGCSLGTYGSSATTGAYSSRGTDARMESPHSHPSPSRYCSTTLLLPTSVLGVRLPTGFWLRLRPT